MQERAHHTLLLNVIAVTQDCNENIQHTSIEDENAQANEYQQSLRDNRNVCPPKMQITFDKCLSTLGICRDVVIRLRLVMARSLEQQQDKKNLPHSKHVQSFSIVFFIGWDGSVWDTRCVLIASQALINFCSDKTPLCEFHSVVEANDVKLWCQYFARHSR
eukprot:4105014-Amphidinium_carterae.1